MAQGWDGGVTDGRTGAADGRLLGMEINAAPAATRPSLARRAGTALAGAAAVAVLVAAYAPGFAYADDVAVPAAQGRAPLSGTPDHRLGLPPRTASR
ncbi:hypothetical protein [Kitasatospora sp. GP82]|uniref:hypothetical protein n=1 Tax=Kitasatospora sp. GP82 TaxID=3035089 RepID=UPI00247567E4|nr:hypothetical protein [Kitasatospora sp. GP82]MDH6126648.1 hypothetical protein [Kitasatospora sp. GP82]